MKNPTIVTMAILLPILVIMAGNVIQTSYSCGVRCWHITPNTNLQLIGNYTTDNYSGQVKLDCKVLGQVHDDGKAQLDCYEK